MDERTTRRNIEEFERLTGRIKRKGIDRLMTFIRKSDFYQAPASTRFHLSCEAGLLQHSLNVYKALTGRMEMVEHPEFGMIGRPRISGSVVAEYPEETLIITALFHDICKTHFYKTDYKNQKVYKPGGSKRDPGGAYDWERVPFYAIEDREPYGHGEKSVMMLSEFIYLTKEERYAIRWHMGMAYEGPEGVRNFNASIERYPLVLFLHNADQEASHFMEDTDDNKELFRDKGPDLAEAAYDASEFADQPVFQEATPI